jgi:hypothetical protein
VTAALLAASFCRASPVASAVGIAARASVDPIRTLSADSRSATFEYVAPPARFDSITVESRLYARVTLPGAVVTEPAGHPALPAVSIPFGVPDGMSPRLSVVNEEWETRAAPPPIPVPLQRYVADDPKTGPESEFRYDQDAAIYAGTATFPPDGVTLAPGAPLGEMWTAAALVRPVRFEPRAGVYRVLRRMVIRVDFVAAADREKAGRPAFRPDAEASIWKRVQKSMLRNFDAARAFPRRPGRAPAPPRAPRRLGQGNPEFKITVTQTGWSSLSYAALGSAGFPAGVSIAQIGLWERGYDDVAHAPTATPIPVLATDANGNGVFDAGDAIAFYAQNRQDRLGAGSLENRYDYANVYWLTWTSSPAAAVDSTSGAIPTPTPELPTWFSDTIHMEQNQYLLASPSAAIGSPPENVEHFFWTHGSEPDAFTTPVTFVDPDASQPFRIQARYQGQNGSTHHLSIYFDSSTGATDTLAVQETFFNQDVYVLDTGLTLPGALIGGGTGQYRHAGDRQSGGPVLPGSAAWLDWIEVTYAHKYLAAGDHLAFTSGSISAVGEIHVGGFTVAGANVFDVTDPGAPLRVTAVRDSLLPGGTHEISFRCDASAGVRRYVALTPGAEIAISPLAVAQDAPSALTVPSPYPGGSEARTIIIAPKAFFTPAIRLADFRRGQGYVVEVADIEDVYDEFSGGLKSAQAIRRYFEYAFQNWTPRPSFAVLAGDASMDYRHDLPQSSVDWIPTYLEFETISGPQGIELVASDPFYSLNLANASGGVSAFVPSIFLGRIPAGSAAELDAYVDKVVQYEQFAPTDGWRGRQLLVSDDQYSTSIFFTGNYCLHVEEAMFHDANQAFADITAASQSGQDVRSDFWDLKTYTDVVPTYTDPFGQTCRSLNSVLVEIDRTGGAVQQFIAQAAQGGLILNVEAHANRYLIAHEQIFCVPSNYCASLFGTDQLGNDGKPYLFMVWGCHANQFADGPISAGATVDSTDALGEQWLLKPSGGSIGSIGSSAFELLDTNAALSSFVADAFYTEPPAPVGNPGDPQRGRWIMGEVWSKALIRNAQSAGNFLQQIMSHTENLLGDPMVHMDALPPRIFQVNLDGVTVPDGAALATDSPTDSLTLVADVRDEVTIAKTDLAERLLPGGTIVPLPLALFRVTQGDTGRADTLTARVRPRASNYDLLVRAFDLNGRERDFTLQVRTAVRYTADGKDILNGEFVGESAVLRAEVTTPIPVPADSLQLLVDGVPIVVTRTQTDGAGRHWTLESLPEARGPGSHELRIAVGGRSAEFDPVGFRVDTSFRILHVAVVSTTTPVVGCGGSVFQYELTAPAARVRLMVHTIAGRRIAALDWPGVTGINVQCWDGRDSQGNEMARGVYFYRLTATDPTGRTVMQTGRMIYSPR